MKTFKNLDTENRDRIIAFNAIQFNIMQFNQHLQHCEDIVSVAHFFDEFLSKIFYHESDDKNINMDDNLGSN